MAVVASKRKPTSVDYYDKAMNLRLNMTKFLLKDFGTSKKNKDIRVFAYRAKMSEPDMEELKALIDKYELDIESCYPFYILDYARNLILHSLDTIMYNLVQARSTYPTSMSLYEMRAKMIQIAINECDVLLTNFEYIVQLFTPANADLSKYDFYIDQIKDLKSSIKKFRKSNNDFKEPCYNADLFAQKAAYQMVEAGVQFDPAIGTGKYYMEKKKLGIVTEQCVSKKPKINKLNPLVDDEGYVIKKHKHGNIIYKLNSKNEKVKPGVWFDPDFNILSNPKISARPGLIFDFKKNITNE